MSSVGREQQRTASAVRTKQSVPLPSSSLLSPAHHPLGFRVSLLFQVVHSQPQPHCSIPNNNSPAAPPSWLGEEAASLATTLQLTRLPLSCWPPSPILPFPGSPPLPHNCFAFCSRSGNSDSLKLHAFLDKAFAFVFAGPWFLHLQLWDAASCVPLEEAHGMDKMLKLQPRCIGEGQKSSLIINSINPSEA